MTVLDILMNAMVNLVDNKGNMLSFIIGSEQLKNAIAQLEINPDASAEFKEKE